MHNIMYNVSMITPQQIRMARAALNWTMADISERTGLHRNTLANVEQDGATTRKSTLNLLESVFKDAGISFDGDTCVCVAKE
jgi:transcriptional regulator with XRE-family HTH domain